MQRRPSLCTSNYVRETTSRCHLSTYYTMYGPTIYLDLCKRNYFGIRYIRIFYDVRTNNLLRIMQGKRLPDSIYPNILPCTDQQFTSNYVKETTSRFVISDYTMMYVPNIYYELCKGNDFDIRLYLMPTTAIRYSVVYI